VTQTFGRAIDPYPRYEAPATCDPTEKPGPQALRTLLQQTYGSRSFAITRACSGVATSDHNEGRALDWMVNAADPGQRDIADSFVGWLLASDQYGNPQAMARRLGIAYIIWNTQMFRMYDVGRGWQPYTGSSPHTDHVHFSFSWNGASGQTSWFGLRPLCLASADGSNPITDGSCRTAQDPSLAPGPPRGNFEGVTLSRGVATVVGWALDPDTASSVPVQVWVDGRLAVYSVAADARPDVAQAFAGYGEAHGYALQIPLAPGNHLVCLAAADAVGGHSGTGWGCRTAFVPTPSPFGNAETVTASAGRVFVGGWAIDPDSAAPVPVQVWVDGALVAFVPANGLRPDVAAVHPDYGPNRGFSVAVSAARGPRTVCVALSNAAAGADVGLRCARVNA
jgi:hypothetical protein